jgi:hypothetical protein
MAATQMETIFDWKLWLAEIEWYSWMRRKRAKGSGYFQITVRKKSVTSCKKLRGRANATAQEDLNKVLETAMQGPREL